MKNKHPILAADAFALGTVFYVLHAAIVLNPGSTEARATASLFRKEGLYRKTAGSFTAREGGRAMTARAERIIAFVRAEFARREKRRRAARRKRQAGAAR